jgi:hypothetical protein
MSWPGMNQEIFSSAVVAQGAWFRVDGLDSPFTVSAVGFETGDVAQVWASNEVTEPGAAAPAAGDGTFQYGSDITEDSWMEVTPSFRWMRMIKTAAAGSPATTKGRIQGRGRPA